MNLNQVLDIYFGGEGSGCDPEVAEANGTKCGRPPKGFDNRKYEILDMRDMYMSEKRPIISQIQDWDFDTKTSVGGLGKSVAEDTIELIKYPGLGMQLYVNRIGDDVAAVGVFNIISPPGPHRKTENITSKMYVNSMVMNPKYQGSGELKNIIEDFKKIGTGHNVSRVEFYRAGKGDGLRKYKIPSDVKVAASASPLYQYLRAFGVEA